MILLAVSQNRKYVAASTGSKLQIKSSYAYA